MRLMIPVINNLNVTWLEGIDDRDGEITKTNNERQYFTNITICYLAQYFTNITSSYYLAKKSVAGTVFRPPNLVSTGCF